MINTGSNNVSDYLKCLAFNSQSIGNKSTTLMEHVIDHDADTVFLSETWLKSNKNSVTAIFESYGYTLHHNIRKNRAKEIGGGVGILVKKSIQVKSIKVKQFQAFEHGIVKVCLFDSNWLTLISIYRLLYEPISVFFSEFTELLETISATNEKFIISGDINIHCDEINDRNCIQLNDLLSIFNLSQLIYSPTHRDGHTIDVVIVRSDVRITGMEVNDISLSDHFLISFLADCKTQKSYYKTITYRNTKQINTDNFSKELTDSLKNISTENDFGTVVSEYNAKLTNMMDKHAPRVTKEVKVVRSAPWFDLEYIELRRRRRKAEKTYKRTRKIEDQELFKNLRKQTTALALHKKKQHFTSQINEAKNKQKCLFSIVNRLMDVKQDTSLPTASSDEHLANKFQSYFKEKISKIRETFTSSDFIHQDSTPVTFKAMSTFEPATEDELRAIITSFGISCSPVDPIRAKMLADNIELFIPFWLEVVNLSLLTGSMDCLKSAVISPLLKELDEFIDYVIFKNYRPVSNLLFLSKLIERCVASRLNKHIIDNNLESRHQYGYKKGHSTEMLLTKVVDNLLAAFDKKLATVLLLLDLSAAFDTVDQDKLLHILFSQIGITGIAYKWFDSFLKDRSQQVKINDAYSEPESLDYGVAQGSVLGPILFNIYTRTFYPHVHSSGFEVEGFADDHQLFKQFVTMFQTQVLSSAVNDCLHKISMWMNENFLCLNKSKTKILVLAPPSIMSAIHIHGAFIGKECIRFVDCAKNLGVWLDNNLNFKCQINKVVSSCFKVLREISKIKSFLPRECLNTLVTSLVLSKLDYCNSLYYGIGANEIKKLQSVQNSAIRLIYGKSKYDRAPISHLFLKLHWLKINERIIFKICLIVHKCIWGLAPDSLKSMIVIANPRTFKLVEKKFRSAYGERAFSRIGPKLWNNLPLHVRMENDINKFKKLIKSYLITNSINFYCRVNTR